MKILFDLQLSFVDKATNLFKVDSDSNFNFTKNAITGILNLDPTIEIGLILPPSKMMYGSNYDLVSQMPANVKYYRAPYHTDYLKSRFLFPYAEVIEIVDDFAPDVVWTNDFARVEYYLLAKRDTSAAFKVVAYNHWIDNTIYPKVDSQYTYIYRQLEGAMQADLIMFNTLYGLKFFLNGLTASNLTPDGLRWQYTLALPPLLDCEAIRSMASPVKFEEPSIIFNHRMSSLNYYSDNFQNFFQACESLQVEYPFKVYCTNPSGYNLELPEYMEGVSLEKYEDYINFISKCHIGVGFFLEGHGQWSMSLAELAVLGIPFIIPNMFGYPSLVPPYYPYLFNSFSEGEECLRELLEVGATQEVREELMAYADTHYSVKTGMKAFVKWIAEEIKED